MTAEPLTIRTYITLQGDAASVTLDLTLPAYDTIVRGLDNTEATTIEVDHDDRRYTWNRAAIVAVEANLPQLRAAQKERSEQRAAKKAADDAADAAHAAKLTPGTHVKLASFSDGLTYRVVGHHDGRIKITNREDDDPPYRTELPHNLDIVEQPELVENVSDDMDRIMDAEGRRFADDSPAEVCNLDAQLAHGDIVTHNTAPGAFRVLRVDGSRTSVYSLHSGVVGWLDTDRLTLHSDPDRAVTEMEG